MLKWPLHWQPCSMAGKLHSSRAWIRVFCLAYSCWSLAAQGVVTHAHRRSDYSIERLVRNDTCSIRIVLGRDNHAVTLLYAADPLLLHAAYLSMMWQCADTTNTLPSCAGATQAWADVHGVSAATPAQHGCQDPLVQSMLQETNRLRRVEGVQSLECHEGGSAFASVFAQDYCRRCDAELRWNCSLCCDHLAVCRPRYRSG